MPSPKTLSNSKNVLALDAGFSHFGWAVVNRSGPVLASGCIVTEKIGKKGAVRVADSDAERCALIARELGRVMREYHIAGVVCELPGGGARAARAISCMAKAGAIVAALVEIFELPAEWITPQAVKAITGKRTATKEDVANVVLDRWPGLELPRAKSESEHILDALGAYIAAENGAMLRTLMRSN